ncbi:hypothetical protein LDENG_00296260, partial [Lucifuga dentata]
ATRSLQLAQNTAARILTKTRKFDHITPILASLHWLPVQATADFKVLLLAYEASHGLAPPYLSELITPHTLACPLALLMLVSWSFLQLTENQVGSSICLSCPLSLEWPHTVCVCVCVCVTLVSLQP